MTRIPGALEHDRGASSSSTGRWSVASALALLIGLSGVARDVQAQWSLTNLHPAGEYSHSTAAGTSSSGQVGSVVPDGGGIGIAFSYASLWNDTAESWVNQSAFAPVGFLNTVATGIWSDGVSTFVAGHGYDASTERSEALLWTVPAPGAIGLLGLAGLLAARPSRVHTSPLSCDAGLS